MADEQPQRMSRIDKFEYGWQWIVRALGVGLFTVEAIGAGRGYVVMGAVSLIVGPSVYNFGRKA